MLVYAGIDEAGYGPMLGPLCVACSAFVVHDHDPETAGGCDLWQRLKQAVCKKRTDKRHRIAVDDSKEIKLPNDGTVHPLRFLERGVLSFLSVTPSECDESSGTGTRLYVRDDELFRKLQANIAPADWYRSTTALPVANTEDELRIVIARLRHVLKAESIGFEALRCEVIDAETFNRQVRLMGFKSNVNFCAVLRLIDAIWQRWPTQHPRVIVDRQGGRMHYVGELLRAWPEAKVQILAETETLSRYRLDREGALLTLSFMVEAESAHLPVALASMTAKYVRELMMIRLNRYFQTLMPQLKPTAGYTEDARRYIAEIEPLISRLGVDRRMLIRAV
jgi:hypothetical protein